MHFAHGGEHARAPLAIGAVDGKARQASVFEQVARTEAGAAERRILTPREPGEAAVDDRIAYAAQGGSVSIGERIRLIAPGGKDGERDAFGQRRIEVNVGQTCARDIDRAGSRFRRHRGIGPPIGKARADRRLNIGHGIVAHHHQHRVGGRVGPPIQRPQLLRRGTFQHRNIANRQARTIARAGSEEGDIVFKIALLEPGPIAPLGQNHPALSRDGVFGNGQLARGFAHQHQRGAQQRGIIARQVEHVGDALEPGGSIGVRAKRQPFAFEQLDHLAFGDVRRPVEGHVFEKVRKPALVVALFQRARSDPQPHQCRALGRRVATDDIAHPVVEAAEGVVGIDREIAGFECPERCVRGIGHRRILRCKRCCRGERIKRQQHACGKDAGGQHHDRKAACGNRMNALTVTPSPGLSAPYRCAAIAGGQAYRRAGMAGWGRSSRFRRWPAPASARSTSRRYCPGCR